MDWSKEFDFHKNDTEDTTAEKMKRISKCIDKLWGDFDEILMEIVEQGELEKEDYRKRFRDETFTIELLESELKGSVSGHFDRNIDVMVDLTLDEPKKKSLSQVFLPNDKLYLIDTRSNQWVIAETGKKPKDCTKLEKKHLEQIFAHMLREYKVMK